MNLKSSSFKNGEEIPKKHGYKFENTSPELIIDNVPSTAKSLVLIMDDPDAMGAVGKIWVHWLVWNISPDTKILKENLLPKDVIQGRTDFSETKYGGPAPPDKKHTYFFKLYAIDKKLELSPNSTKSELENSINKHILDTAILTGTFTP